MFLSARRSFLRRTRSNKSSLNFVLRSPWHPSDVQQARWANFMWPRTQTLIIWGAPSCRLRECSLPSSSTNACRSSRETDPWEKMKFTHVGVWAGEWCKGVLCTGGTQHPLWCRAWWTSFWSVLFHQRENRPGPTSPSWWRNGISNWSRDLSWRRSWSIFWLLKKREQLTEKSFTTPLTSPNPNMCHGDRNFNFPCSSTLSFENRNPINLGVVNKEKTFFLCPLPLYQPIIGMDRKHKASSFRVQKVSNVIFLYFDTFRFSLRGWHANFTSDFFIMFLSLSLCVYRSSVNFVVVFLFFSNFLLLPVGQVLS